MSSKFKPTRVHKRKHLARQTTSDSAANNTDSNTTLLVPETKPEREERRQHLRDELRSQQPKVSAKKAKRLDKYIEKKLKKDEAADLVRKLEAEKKKWNVSGAGLQSSKRLGFEKDKKRKFEQYVEGQVQHNVVEDVKLQQNSTKKNKNSKDQPIEDDTESVDSFEEDNSEAFDPEKAPVYEPSTDDSWLKKKAAPVQGTGLAQPLRIGPDGMPVIPTRNGRQRAQEKESPSLPSEQDLLHDEHMDDDVVEELPWEGFSGEGGSESEEEQSSEVEDDSEAEEQEVDSRLKNIDSKVLDALLAELERDDESDESDESMINGDDNGGPMDEQSFTMEEVDSASEQDDSEGDSGSETGSETSSETSAASIASREDVRLKPRASAFKSWATQQLNQSMGHTPFYDQPQEAAEPSTEGHIYEKPAAGFRIGVPVLDAPTDDRRAYTVNVERQEDVQTSRSHLPILQREQEIMEAVHNHPVIVIKGDTGSGKTTQIPQFLFEAGFGDKSGPAPGMIGVTQPRRVAAVSMAKRVAEELGDHGDKVAHQIRFDTTVSVRTAIKFMTDGILLRELSQDLLLKKYSAIVIDEAHERSVNTDLLIGMLSKIVPARLRKTDQNPDPKPLKLIIMSATLNINDFLHAKLFSSGMRPPVVEAEGRQYKVTTHFALRSRADYIEETIEKIKRAHRKLPPGGMLVFLTGQNEIKYVLSRLREDLVRSAQSVDDNSMPRMYITATDAPLEMDDLDIGDFHKLKPDLDTEVDMEDDIDILTDEAEADKEFEISDDEEEQEVSKTKQGLGSKLTHNNSSRDPYDTVHLLPLYSQLPTKDQLRIFQPPPDRSRLIVLATNVAETSLTIPGIRYVFDCGRSKEKKYDTATNVQSFEIDYISKASAQQRAGRAGRTGPGHCWRLYSSAVYEQFFPDYTEPEILRTPAESVVLQLKGFRYPRPVVDFPFPSPPNKSMLMKAERLLKNLGAIEAVNGALTELGKKLSLYPLSPRLGKIVVNAMDQQKVLAEMLMLTAALSVDDVFISETQLDLKPRGRQEDGTYTRQERDDDEYREKQKQAYGRAHAAFSKNDKSSDALKLVTAVEMYLEASHKEDFCSQYFLRPKAMLEINQLYNQLRSMISANQPSLKASQPNKKLSSALTSGINKVAASGYIDQIALRFDLHPTPPVLPKRPTRAIDVPYFPLTPLSTSSHESDIVDKAVFIHPSSLFSRQSTQSLPDYIVYKHLQTSQPTTINPEARTKTRMLPLCPLDANTLLVLIRNTGLIEYGKPIPKTKIEDIPNTRPKERKCWVTTEIKQELAGAMGWPLPPSRVRQVMDLKSASGWKVVEVLA